MRDGKGIKITSKVLNEPGCKSSKIWLERGREFYNRSMKSWLRDDGLEFHWKHSKEKSIVVEGLIKNLKKKFTSIWMRTSVN